MRHAILLPVVALPLLLAGCRLPRPAAYPYNAATAQRPPHCSYAGKSVPLPAGIPSQFPFPAHTTVTYATPMPGGVTRIRAYIASRDFAGTVKFFEDYLPLAGFAVTAMPTPLHTTSEVSESFLGHGATGYWTVTLPPYPNACPGEVVFSVEAFPGNTPYIDPG